MFSEEYIRSLCVDSEYTYRKAYVYFLTDRVHNIDNSNGKYTASIDGYYNRVYTTSVTISNDYKVIAHTCSCKAHQRFRGPCKHVTALLLSILYIHYKKLQISNNEVLKKNCIKAGTSEISNDKCNNELNKNYLDDSEKITSNIFDIDNKNIKRSKLYKLLISPPPIIYIVSILIFGIVSVLMDINIGIAIGLTSVYFGLFAFRKKIFEKAKTPEIGNHIYFVIFLLVSFLGFVVEGFACSFLIDKTNIFSDTYKKHLNLYSLFNIDEGVLICTLMLILLISSLFICTFLIKLVAEEKSENKIHNFYFFFSFIFILIPSLCICSCSITGYKPGLSCIYYIIKSFVLFLSCILLFIDYQKSLISLLPESIVHKYKQQYLIPSILGVLVIIITASGVLINSSLSYSNKFLSKSKLNVREYLAKNRYSLIVNMKDYGDSDLIWCKKIATLGIKINNNKPNLNFVISELNTLDASYRFAFSFNEKTTVIYNTDNYSDLLSFLTRNTINVKNIYSYSLTTSSNCEWYNLNLKIPKSFQFDINIATI